MTDNFSHYLTLKNNCDPEDPLLSSTPLGRELDRIPLDQVSPAKLKELAQALDLEQLIPTEAGLARDYRGLAELMGYNAIEVETCFKSNKNPTNCLLGAFMNNGSTVKRPSVNELLKMLEKIERFDIIDDFMPVLVEIASHQNDIVATKQPYTPAETTDEQNTDRYLARAAELLTIDDTPDSIIIYDAFVCYAPEDHHHAANLIAAFQAEGLTVTTPDRILPGLFEYDSVTQMIDSRCKKVVIILTPNFARSKECKFQTKFASELGMKAESPKIIPVIFERCDSPELPTIIKVLSKIDLSSAVSRSWQMARLIRCLQVEASGFSRACKGSTPTEVPIYPKPRIAIEPSPQTLQVTCQPCLGLTQDSNMSREGSSSPIIELMPSRDSHTMSSFQDLPTATPSSAPKYPYDSQASSPNGTNVNPVKWLKQIVRRKRTDDIGTSSRANLLTASPDLSIDD